MGRQVAFPLWTLKGENAHRLPNTERYQGPDVTIDQLVRSFETEIIFWLIPLLQDLVSLPAHYQAKRRHNAKQIDDRNDEGAASVLAPMGRLIGFGLLGQ